MDRSYVDPWAAILTAAFLMSAGRMPAAGQYDTVINLPSQPSPVSVGENTQLNLFAGGELSLTTSDATPNGFQLGLATSEFNNSEINVLGGAIRGLGVLTANPGTRINVDGGELEAYVDVLGGSEATFSGGTYAAVRVFDGGTATLSGGWLSSNLGGFSWQSDATAVVVGNDFWLNNQPIATGGPGSLTNVEIGPTDLITGKFADGRPFGFKNYNFATYPESNIEKSILSLRVADQPTPPQSVFNIPGDEIPQVGSGQTVRFNRGSPLTPEWLPSGRFVAFPGSRVEINDGGLVDQISAYGAEIEMSGGSLYGIQLIDSSEFRMTDGSTYGAVGVQSGSRFTVSGGGKYGDWGAGDGGEIHVIGTEFSTGSFTPGVSDEIQQLSRPGDSYIVKSRAPLEDGAGETIPFVLEGTLLNGQTFDWELSKLRVVELTPDFSLILGPVVDEQATVRITIGFPEDYCDFDGSETCDSADIDSLESKVGSNDRHFDLTYDGLVDQRDVQQLLSNGFRGDANLDGVVDVQDLNIVGLNWQSRDNVVFADGDFNVDGIVDASDLNDVGTTWLDGIATAPIPEPAGNFILVIGAVLILLQTRSLDH